MQALTESIRDSISTAGSWGKLAPQGAGIVLLQACQLGLAHGPIKKLIGKLWRRWGMATPVDIRYAGLKFRLHPWDNTVEYKMLFGSGLRDKLELACLQKFAGNGGVFLDIGANIGYYALMAAHSGASRVVAFEPNPLVFSRLKFNIDANAVGERILALQIALGDQVATTTMMVSGRDMGGSYIGSQTDASATPITVDMRPLVGVLTEQGIDRVDALKIDVEGMEDAVLLPFFQASSRRLWPRLVIIEYTSQHHWKQNILIWLLQSGYQEIARNRSNAILRLVESPV